MIAKCTIFKEYTENYVPCLYSFDPGILTLLLCLLFSTTVFVAESGAISSMTYEEWLVEQEAVDDDSANEVMADLEPVIVSVQGQET